MQELKETWVWSLSHEDPLVEGTAALSSILAWRILWIEETGGLTVCGVTKRQTRLKWLSSGKISDFIKLIQISKSFKCEKKNLSENDRVHTPVVYIHWVTLYNVFPTVGHGQRGLKTFHLFWWQRWLGYPRSGWSHKNTQCGQPISMLSPGPPGLHQVLWLAPWTATFHQGLGEPRTCQGQALMKVHELPKKQPRGVPFSDPYCTESRSWPGSIR